MFIENESYGARTPSGVPCPAGKLLHFSPDGWADIALVFYRH